MTSLPAAPRPESDLPVVLESTITCPSRGHRSTHTMPTDACQYIHMCGSCGVTLKPKKGDCCVYCSYGDVPCPPIQEERAGMSGRRASCQESDAPESD
jgi:hypothetical protein